MKISGERHSDGVRLTVTSRIRSEGTLLLKLGHFISQYNLSGKDITVGKRTIEMTVNTTLSPDALVSEAKKHLSKSRLTKR